MVGSGKWKWEVGVMLYNTGSVEFVAFLQCCNVLSFAGKGGENNILF